MLLHKALAFTHISHLELLGNQMNWLPSIFKRKLDVFAYEQRKTEALVVQAQALKEIANFVTNGGLNEIAKGLALSNTAASLLNGLTAHDGRKGLDARTLTQNAKEIAEFALRVKDQFQEKLAKRPQDSEIHDSEADYKKWTGK